MPALSATSKKVMPAPTGSILLKLTDIDKASWQPRKIFDPEKLAQLAATIEEYGVLEDIIVRPKDNGRYELVVGERRLRASEIAGKTEISAKIQDLTDLQAKEIALIENVCRQDLDPIEETNAVLELLSSLLDLSKEETISCLHWLRKKSSISPSHNVMRKDNYIKALPTIESYFNKLGMNWQSFASNRLPLLNLSEKLQEPVRAGKITSSVARKINTVEDPVQQSELLDEAIDQSLSVREVSQKVQSLNPSVKEQAIARSQNSKMGDKNVLLVPAEIHSTPPLKVSPIVQIKRSSSDDLQAGDVWQISPRTILFCGNPDEQKFLERLPQSIALALEFPTDPNWERSSSIPPGAKERFYYFGNHDKWDAAITTDTIANVLDNSTEAEEHVCFLFFPPCTRNIWKIFLDFDIYVYIAEPDLVKCKRVLESWNSFGLVSNEKGEFRRRFVEAKLISS